MQKNILFESSAIKEVLVYLENTESYRWNNIQYLNQGRYAVVKGKSLSPNIAILFKKEWFLKFGEILEQKGIGDTINCEHLRLFNSDEYKIKTIYIMHKSGSIYKISLYDFLTKSICWENKEGKEVRSISIHNYKRVNKE